MIDSALLGLPWSALGFAFGVNADTQLFASSTFSILYFVVAEGLWGQTIGKRCVGVRVVRATNLETPGILLAAIRYIGRIISALFLLLGYFWMLWDSRRQTWHDKLSSTLVIRTTP
jgi:uncharacterized RDD family membrane protein YckC